MNDPLEIVKMFAIALLIAVTVVGVPYAAFQLITFPVRRQATIQLVIAQISATIRQHIPLATGLAIAAQSEPARARRRLTAMSKLIAKGKKLSDAMREAFPECPGLLISLVNAGERSGQLPAAVQQAERYVQDHSRHREAPFESPLAYALVVVCATATVATMVMIVIVPKFEEIFHDFGVDCDPFCANLHLAFNILFGALLVLLALLPISMWAKFKTRKTPVPGVVTRWIDWLRWHTPGLSKMELGHGMSSAFGTMEFCLNSGMNLHEAVHVASGLDINWQLRQKIQRLSDELANGTDAGKAARQADIGGIAATVLAAGARQHNLANAVRFAADYYGGLLSRWWMFVSNIIWPVCTLLLACIVGFFVYSLFQPLGLLIDATLTSTGL